MTQYFIHKLLRSRDGEVEDLSLIESFLQTYGSYLQLHESLVQAGAYRNSDVVKLLLDLAKYDPTHKEALKQVSKLSSLFFYETVSTHPCSCSKSTHAS